MRAFHETMHDHEENHDRMMQDPMEPMNYKGDEWQLSHDEYE